MTSIIVAGSGIGFYSNITRAISDFKVTNRSTGVGIKAGVSRSKESASTNNIIVPEYIAVV